MNPCPNLTETTSTELYGSPAPGLPLLVLDTDYCYAVIAMQGAQLLEFKAKPEFTPLLWLSPLATFEAGKAIRGGIPLCAPWFGPHPTQKSYPKHGFVRNDPWLLTASHHTHDHTALTFTYTPSSVGQSLYTHPFRLTLKLRLSTEIDYTFDVENLGDTPMHFSWALHSYHPVGDVATVQVEGLENLPYLDATDDYAQKSEAHPIRFAGELDRVYENVPATQIIRGMPSLEITGDHCPTCIVWNPGEQLAATMADVREGWRDYICVERGAARADTWEISAHATQQARLRISLLSK